MPEDRHGLGVPSDAPAREEVWAVKASFFALLTKVVVEGGDVTFSVSAALLEGTAYNLGNPASDIAL